MKYCPECGHYIEVVTETLEIKLLEPEAIVTLQGKITSLETKLTLMQEEFLQHASIRSKLSRRIKELEKQIKETT